MSSRYTKQSTAAAAVTVVALLATSAGALPADVQVTNQTPLCSTTGNIKTGVVQCSTDADCVNAYVSSHGVLYRINIADSAVHRDTTGIRKRLHNRAYWSKVYREQVCNHLSSSTSECYNRTKLRFWLTSLLCVVGLDKRRFWHQL